MSKPPANWTDTDVDDAELGLAELARDFVRREALIDRNEESLTNCDGQSERLVLAALAELSARRMRAG